MEKELTHFDEKGNAVMVDVSDKEVTSRMAIATGRIKVNEAVFKAIAEGTVKKGDVLGVARIAGIMAAKKTWELIPMCHPLMLTKCSIEFLLDEKQLEVEASCLVKVNGKTGVEMEALTGVNVALLTIYDMCKAIDKSMVIKEIKLLEKQGGKSGHYRRSED
ncbi:MAG: cyclic pyranopterin monophosphate synthase MoaC [Candidatus Cellulosilyticum pullistercoris]|uniref:Cyclic pyranopterin monophosphate synthase n=1 Tax=Candidatus Cellulosilyticum pullistercoris TaxID=2838521 RepID=A0A9E2KBY8_9FIRM|nr:cyclic pyranopterin monophosphate synthase MoaC [Candidatus Cellulosilyticum pullistercoris]